MNADSFLADVKDNRPLPSLGDAGSLEALRLAIGPALGAWRSPFPALLTSLHRRPREPRGHSATEGEPPLCC